ncbi:tetratricopeptide repeat protein [uncultured Hydrogenophaga sp.]|uniref:tetratricopeptide repeat protein n=1 Tax=uncultured Hydrogenophaga sp. TaxID=199683 RepID=UPI00265F632C|nr:tetratricopeptide repeat protein [uncultured Hydrogenophaga sp.]
MQADLNRPAATDCGASPLSSEDRRLLAEIGFLAVTLGLPDPARRIFDALPSGPETGSVKAIGQAMSAVLAGRADEAVRLLHDEELARSPGNPDVTSFLAVALLASGRRQQAVQLLEPMAGGQVGSPHSEIARRLLARLAEQGARS